MKQHGGAGWRRGLILQRHACRLGRGAWISSPSGTAKYLTSSTWLSRRTQREPPPPVPITSLFFALKRRRSGTVFQARCQKRSPRYQRSSKFRNLERRGLCIFKTSGPSFGESHARRAREQGGRAGVGPFSNVLCASRQFGERNPQNSTSRLCGLLELVFHIHYLFRALT